MVGRCFLICGLLALAALAGAQQFGRMSSTKESKIGLVVHGGAGTMERNKMTPEREREYRAGIENALRAGWDILQHGGARTRGRSAFQRRERLGLLGRWHQRNGRCDHGRQDA